VPLQYSPVSQDGTQYLGVSALWDPVSSLWGDCTCGDLGVGVLGRQNCCTLLQDASRIRSGGVSRKQTRNIELLDHACGGCGVSQEIPPLESLLGSPIVPKKIEAEARASLKTCRALINRIEAGLSAEELIVNVSSAGELLFYLEFAASVLEKSAPRPRKRGQTAAEDRPGGVIA
jgi:hypothetical protein